MTLNDIKSHKFINLKNKRFGKLKVIRLDSKSTKYVKYWKCKCICGKTKIINGDSLRNGSTKSCGCFHKEIMKCLLYKDISNKKFNRLVPIKCLGKLTKERNEYWWECICECGNKTKVRSGHIISGSIKSCGCLHKQKTKENIIKLNKWMSGPNHPRWRHDISKKERLLLVNKRRIDNNKRLIRWRKKVYKRDDYTCQKCDDNKGGNLVAHHIYSWGDYKNLRYIKNNGITLCVKCHKKFHNKFGYGKNTKKQWKEFKKKNYDK